MGFDFVHRVCHPPTETPDKKTSSHSRQLYCTNSKISATTASWDKETMRIGLVVSKPQFCEMRAFHFISDIYEAPHESIISNIQAKFKRPQIIPKPIRTIDLITLKSIRFACSPIQSALFTNSNEIHAKCKSTNKSALNASNRDRSDRFLWLVVVPKNQMVPINHKYFVLQSAHVPRRTIIHPFIHLYGLIKR